MTPPRSTARLLGLALVACAALAAASSPARAASAAAAEAREPLDFPAAVQLALRHSPLLRQGQIQLEVRRIDEREGRAGFWPAVHLQADYLINAPGSVTEPASLHLTTGEYNPLGAYFTVQAKREITRLAQLTYLQGISDGLRQAAELFLSLATLDQAAALQAEQEEWGRRHVVWCANRTASFGAPMELQAAEQDLVATRLEGERLAIRRRQALRNLAALVGFEVDDPPPRFLTDAARAQVLEDFPAPPDDRARAEDNALELRLLDIHLRLQQLGVKGAYAEFIPRPTFLLRTTDPLDESQEDGLFFSAGLSVPLWDVGRRHLNIHRQKAILEQRVLERSSGTEAWRRRWLDACDQRDLAAADAALAAQRVRLAELNVHRQELAFETGRNDWPALHDAHRLLMEARARALDMDLAADRAALALRHLSRDLLDRYVTVEDLLDPTPDTWWSGKPPNPDK